MTSVAKKVTNAASQVVDTTLNTAEAVVNNPLPVIETIAVTAALGPEGVALGLSSAQTAAVASAAVTAANGGNVKQIADAAISAGVGSEVTQAIAPSTSAIEGAAPGSTPPLASAAGGAASGATQAALTGQDILKGAATGGLVSGGSALGAQEVSSLLSPGTVAGTGIKAQTSVGDSLDLIQPSTGDTQTGTGVVSKYNALGQPMTPTGGGTGVVGDPNAVLPASLSEYATSPSLSRIGPDGTLIPAYQAASNNITPSSMLQYNLPGEETPAETIYSTPQTTPGLSKEAQNALQSVFGFGLSTALAPKAGAGGAIASAIPTPSGGTTGTTSGTTGGSPGGTELDPSTGKTPQLVWGDKYSSLKEGLNV